MSRTSGRRLLPRYRRGSLATPDGARVPYVTLGDGPYSIVFIPGAGDGFAAVNQAALRLAWFYRRRARRYRMLLLSRRQPIPPGFGVEEHADDYVWAMKQFGWGPSVLECNSAGGPIGQWLAAKHPDLARGLILSCTLHRTDAHTRTVLEHWIDLAQRRKWKELSWSGIEHTYRPRTVARLKPFRPLLGLLSRPRDPERPVRLFEGLLGLDNRPILGRIDCPTLVIGGEDDRIINPEVQREMADIIPDSRLQLYPGYGHGNDQENPDYYRQVNEFVLATYGESAPRDRA